MYLVLLKLSLLVFVMIARVVAQDVIFQMGNQANIKVGSQTISLFQSNQTQGVFKKDFNVFYTAGLLVDYHLDNEPFQKEKKLHQMVPFMADQVLEWFVPEGDYFQISFLSSDGSKTVLREGAGNGEVMNFSFDELKRFNGFGYLRGVSSSGTWIRPVHFY